PSLQATFVDYGGNRHGFLAFSEIHPDYYRIPVGDRPAGELESPTHVRENGGDDNGVPLAEALPEPVSVPESAAAEDEPAGDSGGADEPQWGPEPTIDETAPPFGDRPEPDRVEAAAVEFSPIAVEPRPGDSHETPIAPTGE